MASNSIEHPAPPSTPCSIGSDALSDIMTGMTGMGLGPGSNPQTPADERKEEEDSKRPLDYHSRSTVEGSPVLNSPSAKRLDTSATPFLDSKPTSIVSASGAALKEWSCAQAVSSGSSSSGKKGGDTHRVLIVSSGADDEHDTGVHQENALRTTLLVGPSGCLRRASLQGSLLWSAAASCDSQPAPLSDLMRVHDGDYLHYVKAKCALAAGAKPEGGGLQLPSFYAPAGDLDTDTPLGPQSLQAASRFCGAAMWAVDEVMRAPGPRPAGEREREGEGEGEGERGATVTRAFVIGRPPGHHAGPSGCVPPRSFFRVPGMTSNGFCLLNTVGVAAAYARYKYGREALASEPPREKPRIAIVDIDVHHGNGTEEIVRNLTPRMQALPLPSSWAPQWRRSHRPWLDETDAEETFFGSVHLFAADSFYPCSGADEVSTFAEGGVNVVNVALTPLGPGPWDPKTRAKLTPAQLKQLTDAAGAEMREKMLRMLLPALHAFKPTLLLLSSGFDAHHDDLYHFLTEQDYHWITGTCEFSLRFFSSFSSPLLTPLPPLPLPLLSLSLSLSLFPSPSPSPPRHPAQSNLWPWRACMGVAL